MAGLQKTYLDSGKVYLQTQKISETTREIQSDVKFMVDNLNNYLHVVGDVSCAESFKEDFKKVIEKLLKDQVQVKQKLNHDSEIIESKVNDILAVDEDLEYVENCSGSRVDLNRNI